MLVFFSESGYLGLKETILESPYRKGEIPDVLSSAQLGSRLSVLPSHFGLVSRHDYCSSN